MIAKSRKYPNVLTNNSINYQKLLQFKRVQVAVPDLLSLWQTFEVF